MKNLHFIAVFGITIMALSACQKENLRAGIMGGGAAIKANVSSVQTKSSGEPGTLIESHTLSGESGLRLSCSTYTNNTLPFGEGTKGTPVTNDNINEFSIKAYAEDKWWDNTIPDGTAGSKSDPFDAGEYFSAATVTGSNSEGWSIAGTPTWLNKVPITFWSWKGAEPAYTAGTSATSASFSYTNTDAQTDLLYAHNKETREFNTDGSIKSGDSSIDIHFYHALAAVQFYAGSLPEGYRIKSIALKGVNSVTTCTIEWGSTGLSFSHASNTPIDYTQQYDNLDASIAPRTGTGSKYLVNDSKTLFLIPQTLGAGAELEVVLVNTSDATDTDTRTLSLSGEQWKDGKYYVYRINIAGEIDIEVSSSQISNVGTDKAYVRLAIVACWLDSNDNVICSAPYSATPATSGWTSGGDGFFYYPDPVAPGESVGLLYTSFTPTGTAPAGTHFEVKVLVQAVIAKEGSSCQGSFQ